MERNYVTKSRSIALCQITPTRGDPQRTTSSIISWMQKAAKSGADLALFGELVIDDASDFSEVREGTTAAAISNAAKELHIAVIYGYSEIEDTHRYNSLIFFDNCGECVANYRKVHVRSPVEGNEGNPNKYTPGNALTVADWDAGMRIGLGICEDVCVAEYVKAMVMKGGAHLIVIASGIDDGILSQKTASVIVPARAFENRCYIAYVSLAGETHLGMSRVFNPSAECLVSTATKEEIMLKATIPLSAHEGVTFNDCFLHRPELYNDAVAYETELPWKREEAETVQQFFSHRAFYYDDQMKGIYNGPKIAAQALGQLAVEKSGKILDVAAGTGLVGQALVNEGFTELVALDRSEEMLRCLSKKKVYTQLISGAFEEEAKKFPNESFDMCVCVGAFLTSGFLNPVIAVEEMVRLVKNKGIVLLLWNATELLKPQCQVTSDRLEEVLETMVENGTCERVQQMRVPNYLEECEGALCILKKVGKM